MMLQRTRWLLRLIGVALVIVGVPVLQRGMRGGAGDGWLLVIGLAAVLGAIALLAIGFQRR